MSTHHLNIEADYESNLHINVHGVHDLLLLQRALDLYDPHINMLVDSGVRANELLSQDTRISFSQKLKIFSNVMEQTSVEGIALKAGSMSRFSDFGLFGYALVSSATLGDAIGLGFKYLRLAGPVLKKRVWSNGEIGCFEGVDVIQLGDLLSFCTEFWFASIQALCREILQAPFPSIKMYLPYDEPSYSKIYKEVFNCDIEFNAGCIKWEFEATSLAGPVPNANPITVKMCMQTCDDLLALLVPATTFDCEIKQLLLKRPGWFPSIEMIAGHYNMSSRNLRRKLNELGTSFQEILDQHRCNLAIQYLKGTSLSVDEIAERVGFTEASNFRKAFKKWTNKTPKEYRS